MIVLVSLSLRGIGGRSSEFSRTWNELMEMLQLFRGEKNNAVWICVLFCYCISAMCRRAFIVLAYDDVSHD